MGKAALVIMAAGMGSRYGGAKQITSFGPGGERIIDYSLHDAWKAGFGRVVFVINRALEHDFRESVGEPVSRYMDVDYAFQETGEVPDGFAPFDGRKKPWGTCEAVLRCREKVDTPFAVINADDYYGAHAFEKIKGALDGMDGGSGDYAMLAYRVENTLTENGQVARGVCTVENGFLTEVTERTHIERCGEDARFTEDGGESWTAIPRGTLVSMNLWAFTPDIFPHLDSAFRSFLALDAPRDPMKAEVYLPSVVGALLRSGEARVRVLESPDRWYGVTYREDTPSVRAALKRLTDSGVYGEPLWPAL